MRVAIALHFFRRHNDDVHRSPFAAQSTVDLHGEPVAFEFTPLDDNQKKKTARIYIL